MRRVTAAHGGADRRTGGPRIQASRGCAGLIGAAPFLDTDAMLSHPPADGRCRRCAASIRTLGAQVSDDWRRHARGQTRRSSAGYEPHRARAHARRSAAGRGGRHGHRDDSRQLRRRRRHRAAACRISQVVGHVRGRVAGARQRARTHQSRGCRGAARLGRARPGIRLQFARRARGARARARRDRARCRPASRCATGPQDNEATFAPSASRRP